MGKKNFDYYLKGDRVKVIGVSGVGTVTEDQGGYGGAVRVKWDECPSVDSYPLVVNLERVTYEAPSAPNGGPVLGADLHEAVKLIEKEKAELVKQRNSINSRILHLEEALDLLKG